MNYGKRKSIWIMERERERSKLLAVFNRLICSGCYDADGKGESEGKCSSKYKCPPWHFNLIFQEDAENKGNYYGHG